MCSKSRQLKVLRALEGDRATGINILCARTGLKKTALLEVRRSLLEQDMIDETWFINRHGHRRIGIRRITAFVPTEEAISIAKLEERVEALEEEIKGKCLSVTFPSS